MKKIALNGKHGVRKFALVDNEDYQKLIQYNWYLGKNGYIQSSTWDTNTKKAGKIYMHHMIMSKQQGKVIDHINRNTLDNRRINLRFVSYSQNLLNKGIIASNTSGYKNISFAQREKKFDVRVKKEGRQYCIGMYDNIKDALKARELAYRDLNILPLVIPQRRRKKALRGA